MIVKHNKSALGLLDEKNRILRICYLQTDAVSKILEYDLKTLTHFEWREAEICATEEWKRKRRFHQISLFILGCITSVVVILSIQTDEIVARIVVGLLFALIPFMAFSISKPRVLDLKFKDGFCLRLDDEGLRDCLNNILTRNYSFNSEDVVGSHHELKKGLDDQEILILEKNIKSEQYIIFKIILGASVGLFMLCALLMAASGNIFLYGVEPFLGFLLFVPFNIAAYLYCYLNAKKINIV